MHNSFPNINLQQVIPPSQKTKNKQQINKDTSSNNQEIRTEEEFLFFLLLLSSQFNPSLHKTVPIFGLHCWNVPVFLSIHWRSQDSPPRRIPARGMNDERASKELRKFQFHQGGNKWLMMFDALSASKTAFFCVRVRADLNKFLLDGLSSLQLRLDHLDELGRPVFGPNIAESGFFKELQEERSAEVKQSRDRPTDGGDTSSVSEEKTFNF